MKHACLLRAALLATLATGVAPCHADSQTVAGRAAGPLAAQAHLDIRIVVLPSLALRLDGRSARVTSTQDAPLHWVHSAAGTPGVAWPIGRHSLDRVVTVEPAGTTAAAQFITLAAP